MFPYQTRCYTKTDKSITVNIIQRSCASPVNKKKPRSFGTNTLPYCFTYLPEFLEADYNFYQRQWKLEWIRLFNSLCVRISPSGWESASNRLHVTTDRLLKFAADMQKLHWRICNTSHTAGAEITLYTLKLQVPTEAKNFLLIIPINAARLNKKQDRFKNDTWCFKPV